MKHCFRATCQAWQVIIGSSTKTVAVQEVQIPRPLGNLAFFKGVHILLLASAALASGPRQTPSSFWYLLLCLGVHFTLKRNAYINIYFCTYSMILLNRYYWVPGSMMDLNWVIATFFNTFCDLLS
jgi:hypothetical protein